MQSVKPGLNLANVITGVSALLFLVGLILVVWYILLHVPRVEKAALREATFTQYRASADIFWARMDEYRGVCRDLALPTDVSCSDGEGWYRLTTKTEEGFYCLDATGFMGEVDALKSEGQTCR